MSVWVGLSQVAILRTCPNMNLAIERDVKTPCIFCANLMKPAAIFLDLEHINDFQTIAYDSNFSFQNKAKILHSQTFAGHDLL